MHDLRMFTCRQDSASERYSPFSHERGSDQRITGALLVKMKNDKSKDQLVGIYNLGNCNVELWACGEWLSGGDFYFCPTEKSLPRIRVELKECWSRILSVLIHESMEYLLCEEKVVFRKTCDLTQESSSVMFSMDHHQFAQSCYNLAYFMSKAVPDLKKLHSKKFPKKGKK